MSFLVANATGAPPIWVKGTLKMLYLITIAQELNEFYLFIFLTFVRLIFGLGANELFMLRMVQRNMKHTTFSHSSY
jgi:hypothetical protein